MVVTLCGWKGLCHTGHVSYRPSGISTYRLMTKGKEMGQPVYAPAKRYDTIYLYMKKEMMQVMVPGKSKTSNSLDGQHRPLDSIIIRGSDTTAHKLEYTGM